MILGRLFESAENCKLVATIARPRSGKWCAHEFGRSYWGGYVAFLRDDDGQVQVLRDTSADMPCYYVMTESTLIFASDPDLLITAGFLKPQISWVDLEQHLSRPDYLGSTTCLRNLFELEAGSALRCGRRSLNHSPYWHPSDHVQPDRGKDEADLALELETTIQASVQAQAATYRHICLGVSGGLDSSIIAAALARQSTRVTYLTYATDEAVGDERRYANLLRDHLQVPLLERRHSSGDVDYITSMSTHLPRPVGHPFGISYQRVQAALEKEFGFDAFMTGVGGDNVFCFTQSATSLVDRFLDEGASTGILKTLADICTLTDCTSRDALAMAFDKWRRRNAPYKWEADITFLGETAKKAAMRPVHHPWLESTPEALPGKRIHIAMITRLYGTIDGMPRNLAPTILPLLSQPIVEACLRIPMWKWISGGRNRAVARRAFERRLPAAIIGRQSKGGQDSFVFNSLETNKSLIRERLTGGILAEHGLLDVVALTEALSTDRFLNRSNYMRISSLVECENWARYWDNRSALEQRTCNKY